MVLTRCEGFVQRYLIHRDEWVKVAKPAKASTASDPESLDAKTRFDDSILERLDRLEAFEELLRKHFIKVDHED